MHDLLQEYDQLKNAWINHSSKFSNFYKPKLSSQSLSNDQMNNLLNLRTEMGITLDQFDRFIDDAKNSLISPETPTSTKEELRKILPDAEQLFLELITSYKLLPIPGFQPRISL